MDLSDLWLYVVILFGRWLVRVIGFIEEVMVRVIFYYLILSFELLVYITFRGIKISLCF